MIPTVMHLKGGQPAKTTTTNEPKCASLHSSQFLTDKNQRQLVLPVS